MAATYNAYRDNKGEIVLLQIGTPEEIAASLNPDLTAIPLPLDASQVDNFSATASSSSPVQSVSGKTGNVTLDKNDVGLPNVDNTSDLNKPVSTAQASAISLAQSNAQSYADTQISNLVASSPAALDTLNELAQALGNDPNFATTTTTSLGNRLRVDTSTQGLTAGQKTNAKTNIDLQNVDNTSDINKPVSTATQTALNLKVDKTITVVGGNGLTGGGDLTTNRTIQMPDIVTAGTTTGVDNSLNITVDIKGRITSFTKSLISIVSSQISNFSSSVQNLIISSYVVGSNSIIVNTDTVIGAFGKAQAQINNIISTFAANVRNTVLTGISFASSSDVVATDSVLVAIGKLQGKFTNLAFPSPDRSSVQGSGIAFTSTSFANIPGMSTTVSISSTGVVEGIFYYSCVRSTATNATASFRIVINGNNGQTFQDQISTFFDVGAVPHRVSNLPAGTYTVTTQCSTTAPITILECQLTAIAVEN